MCKKCKKKGLRIAIKGKPLQCYHCFKTRKATTAPQTNGKKLSFTEI